MKQVPKSWDDVSLNTGRKIFSIETSGMTDNEYLTEVLNCFDIDITQLKIDEINIYKEKVTNLLLSKPNETIETEFIINGTRYHLIKDLKQLTFGEFLDLELLLSQQDGLSIWNVIHNILGVLLREQVVTKNLFTKPKFKPKDYNGDKVLENGELFDRVLSVNDVYGFATFFLLKGLIYSQTTLSYYQAMGEKK